MADADEDAVDLVEEYRLYLLRFEAIAGPGEFGQFIKHRGRLIKRLRFDEFEPKFNQHRELAKAYTESLSSGDTINDVVVKILRERCDELVLEYPAL